MPLEKEPIIQEFVLLAGSDDNQGLIGIDKKGRPYNKLLRQARVSKGIGKGELGRLCSLPSYNLNRIEWLTLYPDEKLQNRMGHILGIEPELVFPGWMEVLIPPQHEDENVVGIELIDEGQINRRELLKAQNVVSEYAENFVDPHEQAEKRDLKDIFHNILQPPRLTPQQTTVAVHRFGLAGSERLTLERTGELIGVTKERVRQIEAHILRCLMNPSARIIYREYGESYSHRKAAYILPVSYQKAAVEFVPDQDEKDREIHQGIVEAIMAVYEKILGLYNKLFHLQ